MYNRFFPRKQLLLAYCILSGMHRIHIASYLQHLGHMHSVEEY